MRVLRVTAAAAFYLLIILFTSRLLECNRTGVMLPDSGQGGDTTLNTCILQWNLDTIKGKTAGSLADAPIFYPSRHAKFFSEHLFGEMIYAYPLSHVIQSPGALHETTYQLNRLTLAVAIYILCYWLTGSYIASLLSGGLLLAGWQPGQIQNTALGWTVLAMLFFLKHVEQPRWRYALAAALFAVLAALSNGYLAFYTPVAVLLLIAVRHLQSRSRPTGTWLIQFSCACIVIAVLCAPTMFLYKKVHDEYGLQRKHPQYADFALSTEQRQSIEMSDEGRTVSLSAITSFQLLLILPGALLVVTKRMKLPSHAPGFAILGFLAFWMASTKFSPYLLVAGLPGFSGLRAVFRWYLFAVVAVTILNAALFEWMIRKRSVVLNVLIAASAAFAVLWIAQKQASPAPAPLTRCCVYHFLSGLPPRPICSLPARALGQQSRVEVIRMIYQLQHKMPMIGGYSGFMPKLSASIQRELADAGPTGEMIEKLSRTGVGYVVIDTLGGRRTQALRSILRAQPGVRILYDRAGEMIAELPAPPGGVVRDPAALRKLWEKH